VNGRKGVIVDRDATLIDVVRDEETGAICVAFHPSHLRFLPGVLSGLKLLRQAGYTLCIATNQPGPAKGQFSVAAVRQTNEALVKLLGREGIEIAVLEVCMHHPEGGPGGEPTLIGDCDCRKPLPGLLLRAMEQARLEPKLTWMLGDAPADVQAAKNAGIRSALVFPKNRCELCPLKAGPSPEPDLHALSFDQVAREIIARD
jgi:D-glycero-D-manno-heptose 1,7-bisphosphate phosphatase